MTDWTAVTLWGGPLDGITALVDPDALNPGFLVPFEGATDHAWYAPDENDQWSYRGTTPKEE